MAEQTNQEPLLETEESLQPAGTDDKMVLRTENLVKKYGKRTVVNHVSFDVKQGGDRGTAGTERCRQDHFVLYDHRTALCPTKDISI